MIVVRVGIGRGNWHVVGFQKSSEVSKFTMPSFHSLPFLTECIDEGPYEGHNYPFLQQYR